MWVYKNVILLDSCQLHGIQLDMKKGKNPTIIKSSVKIVAKLYY